MLSQHRRVTLFTTLWQLDLCIHNLIEIGLLLMGMLHLENFGDTTCRLAVNAIVLVLGEY